MSGIKELIQEKYSKVFIIINRNITGLQTDFKNKNYDNNHSS